MDTEVEPPPKEAAELSSIITVARDTRALNDADLVLLRELSTPWAVPSDEPAEELRLHGRTLAAKLYPGEELGPIPLFTMLLRLLLALRDPSHVTTVVDLLAALILEESTTPETRTQYANVRAFLKALADAAPTQSGAAASATSAAAAAAVGASSSGATTVDRVRSVVAPVTRLGDPGRCTQSPLLRPLLTMVSSVSAKSSSVADVSARNVGNAISLLAMILVVTHASRSRQSAGAGVLTTVLDAIRALTHPGGRKGFRSAEATPARTKQRGPPSDADRWTVMSDHAAGVRAAAILLQHHPFRRPFVTAGLIPRVLPLTTRWPDHVVVMYNANLCVWLLTLVPAAQRVLARHLAIPKLHDVLRIYRHDKVLRVALFAVRSFVDAQRNADAGTDWLARINPWLEPPVDLDALEGDGMAAAGAAAGANRSTGGGAHRRGTKVTDEELLEMGGGTTDSLEAYLASVGGQDYRRLLGTSFFQQMVSVGLPRTLQVLAKRSYGDQDITDQIQQLLEVLERMVDDVSSFSELRQEVLSNRLEWSPVHRSEKFWKESVHEFERDDYAVLRQLAMLLRMSDDVVTQHVALFDIGEFVRYHPQGRRIVVGTLKIKDRIMELMASPDQDVRKAAIATTQKILIESWDFLDA